MTTLPAPIPAPHAAARPRTTLRVSVALLSRLVLFAAFQSLAALLLLMRGAADPWAASVAWWPVSVVGANLVGLALLRALLHREGLRYRELLRIDRARVGRDLLLTMAVTVVGAVLATAPNLGLATLLWGDAAAPLAILVQSIPLWAALLALVAFPVTVALSELPVYYAYARPQLEALGARPWLAVGLVALAHALQHVTLPLVLEPQFLVWRALMFLPFAAYVGAVLRWRPPLLPYLMVVHGALDLIMAVTILQASLT